MITTESFPRVFFSYPSSLESPGPSTRPEKQGVSGITWFFGEKFVSKIIKSFPRVYSEPAGVKFASIVFFRPRNQQILFSIRFRNVGIITVATKTTESVPRVYHISNPTWQTSPGPATRLEKQAVSGIKKESSVSIPFPGYILSSTLRGFSRLVRSPHSKSLVCLE